MKKRLLTTISLLLALVCLITSCAGTPAHTHAYGEWQTVKNPTCTEDGQKERYCSCGEAQSATIATVSHTWVDATLTEPQKCSVCGETKGVTLVESKYDEAIELLNNKSYDKAYSLLYSIKDYAPAKEKLDGFFFAPTIVKEGYQFYESGSHLGPTMEYDELQYSYDANGNISSITVVEYDNTYNFTYDSLGNELDGYDILSPNSYGCYHTSSYKDGKLIKESYDNSTDEYTYNENGDLIQIKHTYQYESYEDPSIYYTNFAYTYYENGSIKTKRYTDGYSGFELQYNANGIVEKIAVYNNYESEFTEYVGCYSISYGDYGVSEVNIFVLEYSETEPVGEMKYTYDENGRLTEISVYSEGELVNVYLFSGYKAFYSENAVAKERIATLLRSTPETIAEFFN